MASSLIYMDSTLLNLSNESKITQIGDRTKKIQPREVKRGFFETPHAAPLNVCKFSVYLIDYNDSKLDIIRLYSLLAFRIDQNYLIWRLDERVMII